MKTRIIIVILYLINCVSVCFSQPISKEKAIETGFTFFYERATTNKSVSLLKGNADMLQTKVWNHEKRNCMYVISMPDNGWVLVSGDERAKPILAFSKNGEFSDEKDMPPAMLDLLQTYADEIIFIQDSCPEAIIHPDWQSINQGNYSKLLNSSDNDNGKGSDVYTPGTGLLNRPNRGEVRWNQNNNNEGGCTNVYNKFCPDWYSPSCGLTYVGCVAVAIAQIMWYWQWPHTGYIPVSIDKEGNIGNLLELRFYNWDLMPNTLASTTPLEQVDMVAGFLRDCGYAVKMKYGANGSGAKTKNAKKALEETFTYKSIDHKSKFWTRNWETKLRDEINAGRPVYYDGSGSGGHAFVVDGYDEEFPDKFHINWGWGGNHNNYFFLR